MLFRDYLRLQGISDTRIKDLQEGFSALHSALCRLDDDSLHKVAVIGLDELLRVYGEYEDLRVIKLKEEL